MNHHTVANLAAKCPAAGDRGAGVGRWLPVTAAFRVLEGAQ